MSQMRSQLAEPTGEAYDMSKVQDSILEQAQSEARFWERVRRQCIDSTYRRGKMMAWIPRLRNCLSFGNGLASSLPSLALGWV